MATVEAPIHTQIRLHEGPFVNEPLVDFTIPMDRMELEHE